MLLFTRPVAAEEWLRSAEFHDDATGIAVHAAVGPGRHMVLLHIDEESPETDRAGETVGPIGVVADDELEPVSPVYLPPYYRWEVDGWSFEFQSSWREGAAMVSATLRHLRSLRTHPRSLVVEHDVGSADPAAVDAPVAALVLGTPKPRTGQSHCAGAVTIEWRGWHVVEVDDPFNGPAIQVLATHTRAATSRDGSVDVVGDDVVT